MHAPYSPTSLLSILAPLEGDQLALLTNPATDPAGLAAPTPSDHPAPQAWVVPTIQEIEDALNAHVRDGVSPEALLRHLFHPFADEAYIQMDPGAGKVRTSYSLTIQELQVHVPRAGVAQVATQLHGIAQALAVHPVGARAPEGAPLFDLDLTPSGSRNRLRIAAPDADTLRAARNTLSGRAYLSITAPLVLEAPDLVPYVRAARALITQRTLGDTQIRTRAIALIHAAEDIRAAATVCLRQNPDIARYARYTITLDPHTSKVSITHDRKMPGSHHAELAFQHNHQVLQTTLQALLDRHTVLRTLPDTFILTLSGEIHYLSAQLQDTTHALTLANRLSSFEYTDITTIEEFLQAQDRSITPDKHWVLTIGGRTRSASNWTLHGPTLAHALAKAIAGDSEGKYTSMRLIDLLIDTLASQDDERPAVTLARLY